ncbi:hypothetical protein F5Y15DRAFT_374704 [Xylariaceae sp. FL0016]|nr:hypothetical protein F5Y15DRAFT_374704 [Xylariaceae sp. FL0016]
MAAIELSNGQRDVCEPAAVAAPNTRFRAFPLPPPPPGYRPYFPPPFIARRPSVNSTSDSESRTDVHGDGDTASIASTACCSHCRGAMAVEGVQTKTVYEAWEVISTKDTVEPDGFISFCGIRFLERTTSRDDGYVDLNPLPRYEQSELVDILAKLRGEFSPGGKRAVRSYDQDLANRLSSLTELSYDKIKQLIDDKVRSTNGDLHHKREWRVVALQAGEYQMTDALPERRRKGLFRRRPKAPFSERYFFVLRGEEVMSKPKEGPLKKFTRHSNPWRRIDRQRAEEAQQNDKEKRL